jgi:hypothetical protein
LGKVRPAQRGTRLGTRACRRNARRRADRRAWSHGYTGDVYFSGHSSTQKSTVTIDLPSGAKAFAYFTEPDTFASLTVEAIANDGTSSEPIADREAIRRLLGVDALPKNWREYFEELLAADDDFG